MGGLVRCQRSKVQASTQPESHFSAIIDLCDLVQVWRIEDLNFDLIAWANAKTFDLSQY
jgi:hypothetical protein